MKPDRAIYDAAIVRAGTSASEVFFVDDRAENVVGAQAAGLDAVQFIDAGQLAVDLRHAGSQSDCVRSFSCARPLTC